MYSRPCMCPLKHSPKPKQVELSLLLREARRPGILSTPCAYLIYIYHRSRMRHQCRTWQNYLYPLATISTVHIEISPRVFIFVIDNNSRLVPKTTELSIHFIQLYIEISPHVCNSQLQNYVCRPRYELGIHIAQTELSKNCMLLYFKTSYVLNRLM